MNGIETAKRCRHVARRFNAGSNRLRNDKPQRGAGEDRLHLRPVEAFTLDRYCPRIKTRGCTPPPLRGYKSEAQGHLTERSTQRCAYRIEEVMSAIFKSGRSSMICCSVIPVANKSRTSVTRTRMPRGDGRLPHWSGLDVMRTCPFDIPSPQGDERTLRRTTIMRRAVQGGVRVKP